MTGSLNMGRNFIGKRLSEPWSIAMTKRLKCIDINMLDPLPKEKKDMVRCPVDGCVEGLEVDEMRGYAIYHCPEHGEVDPVDLDDDEMPEGY